MFFWKTLSPDFDVDVNLTRTIPHTKSLQAKTMRQVKPLNNGQEQLKNTAKKTRNKRC